MSTWRTTINCHCQTRKFPQGKPPLQVLRISIDDKKEGTNTRPNQRWKLGINSLDKIPHCKLWEKCWQQQQEGTRPGKADLGNSLDKSSHQGNCEKGGTLHTSSHVGWEWPPGPRLYKRDKNMGTLTSKQTRIKNTQKNTAGFQIVVLSLHSLSLTLSFLSPLLLCLSTWHLLFAP